MTGPGSRVAASARRSVFERDGHECVRCGSAENLTLDHVLPKSHGGTNHQDNLQTLCEPCNTAKADHLPIRYLVDGLAL